MIRKLIFFPSEKVNCHQIGITYLEHDSTIPKADDTEFNDNDTNRLLKNASDYTFKEAELLTTGGSDLEHINFFGEVSKIMRLITSKDGYHLTSPKLTKKS